MTHSVKRSTRLGAAIVLLLLISIACTAPAAQQTLTATPVPHPTATPLPLVDPAHWQAGAVIEVAGFDTDDCISACLQAGLASIALSPDGQMVAVGKKDTTLTLWHVVDGTIVRELPRHAGWVTSLAFSPDGTLVASTSRAADNHQALHLWRVADGSLQRRIDLKTTSQVTAIAFHPTDEQVIAVSENHGRLTLWRMWDDARSTRREISDNYSGLGVVQSLAFSADGAVLAAHTFTGIQVWQTDDQTHRGTFPAGDQGGWYDYPWRWIHHVALSPDGTLLAGGLAGSSIRIWHTADGAPLHTLTGYRGRITSVDFSPDGQLLAVAYDDGVIDLWRVADGVLLQSLGGHHTSVVRAVFSADGQTLVSASEDGRILRWYPADPPGVAALPFVPPTRTVTPTPRPTHTALPAPTFAPVLPTPVEAPTVDPLPADTILVQERTRLATGAEQVRAINSDNAVLHIGHTDMQVSPDGRWLAFADDQGVLHAIDLRTGEQQHLADPSAIDQEPDYAFSPDSTALAATVTNGETWQVRVFNLTQRQSHVVWEGIPKNTAQVSIRAWIPAGILMGYQNAQQQWSLLLLEPVYGAVQRLTDGNPQVYPAPGGRWLVLATVTAHSGRFYGPYADYTASLYDLSSSQQQPLIEWREYISPWSRSRSPAWSPDETRLAYWDAGTHGDIGIISREGGSRHFVTLTTPEIRAHRLGDILDVAWQDDDTLLVLLSFLHTTDIVLYQVELTDEPPSMIELATFAHASHILHVPR